MLEKYDMPKQMRVLNAAITEAKREQERVRLQAEARLVDKEQAVRSTRTRFELETENAQSREGLAGR